jgi:hypothetical protein
MTAACDRLPFAAANAPGGPYVVFEIDATALQRQQLENVADQMAEALREADLVDRYGMALYDLGQMKEALIPHKRQWTALPPK